MDKKRLRIALKVLEAVKSKYPETKKFIENLMDEDCQKKNISPDEVIFFTSQRVSSENNFCFAVSMLRDIVLS